MLQWQLWTARGELTSDKDQAWLRVLNCNTEAKDKQKHWFNLSKNELCRTTSYLNKGTDIFNTYIPLPRLISTDFGKLWEKRNKELRFIFFFNFFRQFYLGIFLHNKYAKMYMLMFSWIFKCPKSIKTETIWWWVKWKCIV